MRKVFCFGLMLLVSFCFADKTRTEEKEFPLSGRGFLADFNTYQLNVDQWGVPREIKTGGTALVKGAGVYSPGYYLTESKAGDRRLFQGQKEKTGLEPTKIVKGSDSIAIERNGVFGNVEFPELAAYAEQITAFPSGKIAFHYEVTYNRTLTWQGWGYIGGLFSVPMDLVKGKGYQATMNDGTVKIGVVPMEWTKETNIHLGNIKEIKVSTSVGLLTILAAEKNRINMSDARSYGGKELRFDIIGAEPWKASFEIPEGTKKVIEFTIQIPVKGEGTLPSFS